MARPNTHKQTHIYGCSWLNVNFSLYNKTTLDYGKFAVGHNDFICPRVQNGKTLHQNNNSNGINSGEKCYLHSKHMVRQLPHPKTTSIACRTMNMFASQKYSVPQVHSQKPSFRNRVCQYPTAFYICWNHFFDGGALRLICKVWGGAAASIWLDNTQSNFTRIKQTKF